MQVRNEDLAALLQLQHDDLELVRAQKKLDELPQRRQILALREKKKAIEEKQVAVAEMHREADHELTRISDEDKRLLEKLTKVQEKINEAQGDYRAVEAHTKELGGIAKRRNTIEAEMDTLANKISEIDKVQQQVTDALLQVDSKEAESITSFQQEGGALTNQIASLKAQRNSIASAMEPALLTRYEEKLKRLGGVAVARLLNNSCSVCRNSLDEGKLLQVKAEAPLSECPSCKRMLVVVDA